MRAPIAPSTHAHALSCRVRRVSSDITAPLALHRRLGSVRADTGDARRASAEPRASRRADRAPPTLSCVRRSRRRHTHTHSRVACAVCRVTSPRLLRCIAGSALSEPTPATPAERAPSRERVVVPTERRRPCRACADRAVDTASAPFRVRRVSSDITAPLALLVASAGSALSEPPPATPERAPSRERVVVPTERRRPCRACADRAVDTQARRFECAVCRVTSPRLLLLVASPARLCQSRRRRRRASAGPRASRRADRAPPTSSCVRRSCRRHTSAPFRVRRVSSDITAPLALLVASPARLCQSRRRRRRASAGPRASRRADRAPPTSSCVRRSCRRHTARAVSRAPCVE